MSNQSNLPREDHSPRVPVAGTDMWIKRTVEPTCAPPPVRVVKFHRLLQRTTWQTLPALPLRFGHDAAARLQGKCLEAS